MGSARIEVLHRARVPGEARDPHALVQPLGEIGDPPHELLVRERAANDRGHLREIERARLEVVGALAHRLGGELDRARVRDQDDADLGIPSLGDLQEAHPVHALRAEVGDHHGRAGGRGATRLVGTGIVEHVEGLLAVLHPLDVEPVRLERGSERTGLGGVLVDDERASNYKRSGENEIA